MGPIVVGVDESEGSQRALDWAFDEAKLRGAALRVVHAVPSRDTYFPYSTVEYEALERHVEEAKRAAEKVLDDLLEQAAPAAEGVTVERVVEVGPASDALVRESEQAGLVVVGSRGRGGFRGLLLGSVSQQVVQHASCPVVVIPAHAE